MLDNLPNVHALDRDIPPGKVMLCECGALPPSDPRVKTETLDSKTGWGKVTVRLVARHAGWNIAGSMMRWDNGSFGVVWERFGATQGARYKSFDEALAHFQRIPERDPYASA